MKIKQLLEGQNKTPRILVMNPDDLAELREHLNIDLRSSLSSYKGMKIAISEDIDEVEII